MTAQTVTVNWDELKPLIDEYQEAREAAHREPLNKQADWSWSCRAIRLATYTADLFKQLEDNTDEPTKA